MLTKDDFIRHVLGEAPHTKTRVTKKDTGHVGGFDFADDAPDSEATEDTRFVTPLLQAGFGDGQGIPRATVIRSTDAVAKYIPDEVRYWPKTPKRPHHTLLIEANLTHRELLAIPAFKSRQLAHLDIAEDAVARLVAEALEGFQRGAEGLDASALKGQKQETLCVVSIIDSREEHAGRIACFGTSNAKTEGLETFFLTRPSSTWDRAEARERLGLIYERQFKKLGEAAWQEAFTATDERKQAEKLLEVCTKKNVVEKEIQESILDLLDTIARGFGLRKKPNVERRLQAFPLPGEHDIGIDSEERENKYGGTNPFSGVTLRDDHSRLLGYIVYPLKSKSDAEKLRQHLEKHNRFHNVLVVYPDTNQASIELWQGREQLAGKLRKGQSHKDAADVVNLLSRFFVVSKAKVRNPAELAQELAYRARYLRRLALRQLEDEPEKGPLRNLYNAFKVALVHDQTEDEFADAFAQTITYGLLTARWLGNDPISTTGDRFTRQSALRYLPAASPFLNDLFKSALSLKLDEQRGRLLWLVDDVADLLDRIDVTYVFGAGDKGSDAAADPVIHFYEPFLAAYDSKQKMQRGVFFTPRPVVSYIVRSVHELLQEEFGLKDGLASTDDWGDVATRIKGLKIPNGTRPSDPFVCVLDPATGTGTFLYECIEVIERTMKERWCCELDTSSWQDDRVVVRWNQYVANHLLPRLYGFELMMASYSIAHLKLSFKLAKTGYSNKGTDRLHIYLTNTLEPPSGSANPRLANLFETLANEAQQVSAIKENKRFSVVIGNPPYAGHSRNNEIRWIVDLVKDFTRDEPSLQGPGQGKWLQDDYVKFLRISQHMLAPTNAGILAMITNHRYLTNRTFKGMRRLWRNQFPLTRILDLHGNRVVHEVSPLGHDDNVFDIEQGVAIGIFAKGGITPSSIGFHELWGSRTTATKDGKYDFLAASSAKTTAWEELTPRAPDWLFSPREEVADDIRAEFESGIKMLDLMPGALGPNGKPQSGLATMHDGFALSFTAAEVGDKVRQFLRTTSREEAKRLFGTLCNPQQWDYSTAKRTLASPNWRTKLSPICFSPFDIRYTVYDKSVAVHLRRRLSDHFFNHRNLGMVLGEAGQEISGDDWDAVSCVGSILQLNYFRRNGSPTLPLYLYDDDLLKDGASGRRTNLSEPHVRQIAARLGLSTGKDSLPAGLKPEDIFHYAYAVFHSPGYRRRYADFLKDNFPRLPLTGNLKLFRALAGLGGELTALHLLESPRLEQPISKFFGVSRQVRKVGWTNGNVWINAGGTSKATRPGTSGFSGVPESVWDFHIGGYQVCEKWLKDRKDRTLTEEDIAHYHKIVVALSETIRLMAKIDQVIEQDGGWPNAFNATASAT